MAHAGNWRSILGMPMLHADVPIGVIVITRNERGPFSVGHINLLKSFADQAVIAIENTRLFEEVQTRTREVQESLEYQTAISEVLNVISRSPNELQPVLDTIVETAARLCEAEYSVFFMRQDEGDYRIAATNNAEAEFIKFARDHPFEPTRASCTGRAVIERRTVHVVDAATDPEYDMPDYQRVANNRTMLGVPLLRGDVVIGVIVMVRTVVKPFTEKQIDLVTTFADQALIAIENVRLFEAEQQRTRELRESLEQQTATSDVLRVISSAPGDLSPVFAAILENATRICQAAFGILQLYEDGAFRLAATHNTPPDYSEARRREPIVHPGPQTPLARVAATKQFVHIYDYAEERAYKQRDPGVVRLVELGGARTHVVVPMLKEDELIGTISIYRQEVRPFTNKQIELVTNFANQAVIAIENARLLDELRQRTDALGRSVGELRALGDVSQAVNSTLDLETVLSTIVAKSVELSGTEAGAIYGYDHEAREFRLRATYGMDQELIGALTQRHIGLDQQDVAQAFAQREPIQIADLKDETRSEVNDIIVRAGFRARLLAPLLRGEEIVGMLVVRRKAPGLFAQNTVDLIKTFAAQSALAIQNARLFDNVETRTRELARSLNDLRTAQDRLVQTQKLASLGQLTAGIAHEIKNPLNFVNNFSGVSVELIDELEETLGRVTVDDKTRAEITELADTLRDNLDKIVQHGKRADSIVKNMLLHSREGSGERRLVDVNALVEESLNLAYHGARAEKQGFNVTLERSFDPSAGEVDAFPQEISRVLLNLISNGFYAATKRQGQESGNGFEPTIRAVTKSLGDRVEIRIRDNGTGISREVREKMFNPFFTTKPAGEGTGLGLSISHDIIVKQHSGIIEVDTEAGAFTEFRIILPRTAT
jgi:GAF domain-containing protein